MTKFKKIADFDVARFMGDRSGMGKCFDGFFRGLCVGYNHAFPDEIIQGAFDWDGETLWTPCGYELAYNAWTRIGSFLEHVKGDSDSQRVASYAYQLGATGAGDILFGDNLTLLYADKQKGTAIKSIFEAKHDRPLDARHLTVTHEGAIVFKTGPAINISTRSDEDNGVFTTQTIPLDAGMSWFKLLENNHDSDFSYVAACTPRSSPANIEKISKLMLIGIKNKNILNRVEIDGVLDFSRHPQKEEMVVLGRKLSLLSLPDLKTVMSVELPLKKKNKDGNAVQAVIHHSPCGQYFALVCAPSGEVEIRDAKTLEMIHTLNGPGFPLPDMSWDKTGKYLAYRYLERDNRKNTQLVVWDIQSQTIVFQIASSNEKDEDIPNIAYKWSPHATELACLIHNQRIHIYTLE